MRKSPTIQTRRTKPKKGFRLLHAVTKKNAKRRQRASTAAAPEDLGEVPGVGVARALIVILLLHVAAIAGIFLHEKFSSESDLKATESTTKKNSPPTPIPGAKTDIVSAGDTYESLATFHGVEVSALRTANENKDLEPGFLVNIPSQPEPPTDQETRAAQTEVSAPQITHRSRPDVQTSDNEILPGRVSGELMEVGPNDPDTPLLLGQNSGSPAVEEVVETPPRVEAPTPPPAPQQARTHVISRGDTLYGLARKYKVPVSAIVAANPGIKVKALQLGKSVKIPRRN